MPDHTTTQSVLFPGIFERPVVAKFDQVQGCSDGGAVLLKAADHRLGLTAALAACLKDERQEGKVRHELDSIRLPRLCASSSTIPARLPQGSIDYKLLKAMARGQSLR